MDKEELVPPEVDEREAEKIITDCYGWQVERIKQIDGYDDLNFYFMCKSEPNSRQHDISPHGYILKIINSGESKNVTFFREYFNVLLHLKNENLPSSFPIPNKRGECLNFWTSPRKKDANHVLFVLAYLPGEILEKVQYNKELNFSLGQLLKDMHCKLQKFSTVSAFDRPHYSWSLHAAPDAIEKHLCSIREEENRILIQQHCCEFREVVLKNMHKFEKGLIHGDFNLSNVLGQKRDLNSNSFEIVGIIDFADLQNSCYIFDIAITACYIALHDVHHFDDGIALFLAGYEKALTNFEFLVLKLCICIRLCQALVIGTHTLSLYPNNDYIRKADSMKYGWLLLEKLSTISHSSFAELIRSKITTLHLEGHEKFKNAF